MNVNKKGGILWNPPLSCVLQGVDVLPPRNLLYCPDVAALAEVAPAAFGTLR
jgi:hypothetical protein